MEIEITGCADNEITDTIRAAAAAVERELASGGKAYITVVGEDEIRRLNREFRSIDRVTDVLSFPADEPLCLGDIAICRERALEQAHEYGHSAAREFAFLTVHGLLHLNGYDHIQPQDEAVMLELQRKILKSAGFYRD